MANAAGVDELRCVDPVGNQIRVHVAKRSRKHRQPGLSVLVPVSDIDRALSFYVELLGLAADQASEEFASLRAGDAFLWLHREGDEAVERAGVELWISIDDIDGTTGVSWRPDSTISAPQRTFQRGGFVS